MASRIEILNEGGESSKPSYQQLPPADNKDSDTMLEDLMNSDHYRFNSSLIPMQMDQRLYLKA